MTAHPEGILDTSAVVALPRIADPGLLPGIVHITAITLAELSVGPLVAATDAERSARQRVLQAVESDFRPLPFDDKAARAFGSVAAELRAQGRKTSARAFDALIASIAVAEGLPLYTCNAEDFRGISGLEIVVLPAA